MRKNKNVKKKCCHDFKKYETETHIFKRCKLCHRTIKITKEKE